MYVISLSSAILLSKQMIHYNRDDGSALRCLINFRWLNVWNGCYRVSTLDEQRVRLLVVVLPVCLNLKCVFVESAKCWRSM